MLKEAVSSSFCKSLHKKSGSLQDVAKSRLVAPRRVELSPLTGQKQGFSQPCMHNSMHKHEISTDLQDLIKLWPALPDDTKQQIFSLAIKSVAGGG